MTNTYKIGSDIDFAVDFSIHGVIWRTIEMIRSIGI